MKRAATLITFILGALMVFGQEREFVNTEFVNINTSANGGGYVRYGFTNVSAGTGGWCSGSQFYAGLYWASDPAVLRSGGGELARGFGINNTGLANFTTLVPGFITTTSFGGNRAILGRGGMLTYFQLRAWSAGYSSWEAAMADEEGVAYLTATTGLYAPPIIAAIPTANNLLIPPPIQWAPGTTGHDPLIVMLGLFGSGTDQMVGSVTIPEPGTIALLSLAFVSCGLFRYLGRKS